MPDSVSLGGLARWTGLPMTSGEVPGGPRCRIGLAFPRRTVSASFERPFVDGLGTGSITYPWRILNGDEVRHGIARRRTPRRIRTAGKGAC